LADLTPPDTELSSAKTIAQHGTGSAQRLLEILDTEHLFA
jgi:hypothetical protein